MPRREPGMYGEIRIYSGTANPELAAEIAHYLGVPLGRRDIIRFPNDNIFVRLHSSVREQDVFLIQTTPPPVNDNLMELLIALDTLKRDSAGRITAVVPYLCYARSDKKDQPRVPITARLVAEMIQIAGADRYITIDLHAGQIQGFFNIPGDVLTAFHLLSDYFIAKGIEDLVVVTADLGFAKKGRNYAAKLGCPLAFVEKRRTGNDASAKAISIIGDVQDKNVIIVDDEVVTGGSMAEAVEIVKAHGARDIYLSFTHPILTDQAVERLSGLPIKEIVTTNTVPVSEEKRRRLPNMTVLSVAPLLGEVILRAHEGRSVGEMFNE